MNNFNLSISQRWALFGVLILLVFILCSFKYKLVSSNGEFYRINEITGEVQQIRGTRFIAIDKLKDINKLQLGRLKEWETQKIGKNSNIDVNIKTVWRNGRLYYKVVVTPYDKIEKIQKKNYIEAFDTGIAVIFKDKDNFTIKEVNLAFRNMTHGISTNSLSVSDSIELSYEDMKYVDDIAISWRFEE